MFLQNPKTQNLSQNKRAARFVGHHVIYLEHVLFIIIFLLHSLAARESHTLCQLLK